MDKDEKTIVDSVENIDSTNNTDLNNKESKDDLMNKFVNFFKEMLPDDKKKDMEEENKENKEDKKDEKDNKSTEDNNEDEVDIKKQLELEKERNKLLEQRIKYSELLRTSGVPEEAVDLIVVDGKKSEEERMNSLVKVLEVFKVSLTNSRLENSYEPTNKNAKESGSKNTSKRIPTYEEALRMYGNKEEL